LLEVLLDPDWEPHAAKRRTAAVAKAVDALRVLPANIRIEYVPLEAGFDQQRSVGSLPWWPNGRRAQG
jgi:hypothetical protein